MIRKVVLALVAMVWCFSQVMAMPAISRWMTLTLTNGKVVEAQLVGDEFFSCYMTADGMAIRQLAKDVFEEIPANELRAMREKGHELRYKANKMYAAKLTRSSGNILSGLKGSKRGLVILVNFSNLKFSVVDNPKDFYTRAFNEPGFSDYAFKGSVRDYFLEQSYGDFAVDFDVVGPYDLPSTYKYYGEKQGDRNDLHAYDMAWDAMKAADKDVDYKDYDWDGDGEVEQIYIIYAGYGQNYSGNSSDYIWAHTFSVQYASGGEKVLDGVKLGTYACNCEIQGYEDLAGKPGYELILPEGIGSACHEFSHCLGLPDIYNTDSGGSSSLHSWDLMDGGSYNGTEYNGQHMYAVCPAGYTAHERMAVGWLQPVELNSETQVRDMKPLGDKAREAYIMYNDANHDEFYLLENRQQIGFDECLPGHGLLVTRVTYDQATWQQNSVNANSNMERVSVIAADKMTNTGSQAGDPFPGTGNVTRMTDDTHGATLNTKNTDGSFFMHKAIEYVTESEDGLISFLACRPNLEAPQEVTAVAISDTSFTAKWQAVPGATQYEVSISEYVAKGDVKDALRLEETFAKCYKSTAGFSDIGSTLYNYTDNKGFRGNALYQSPYKLKIGTSTKDGYLCSPVFSAAKTREVTIVLGVKPGKEGEAQKALLTLVMDSRDNQEEVFEFSHEGYLIFHPDIILDDNFRIDIDSKGYMYLNYFAVYDGNYTAEELGIQVMNESAAKAVRPLRAAGKVIVVDEPSCTFAGVTPNSICEILVRALDDVRTSEWSDSYTLQMPVSENTGVPTLREDASILADSWYDLQGRRVGRGKDSFVPRSGLYIRDGKKIVVK